MLINVFVFSDVYPAVQLPGRMVVLFLVSWKISILFPIYIPNNSVYGFTFFYILANWCSLCFCFCFDDGHSDQWDVIPHCGFDLYLHFPDYLWCWASFHLLVDHLNLLFGKMSIQFFCSFFIELLFVWCWAVWTVCWAVWTVYTYLILFHQSYNLQTSSPIQ